MRPEHQKFYSGEKVAHCNPNRKVIDSLPIIFGYNTGEKHGNNIKARLVSEDGADLGLHLCPNENSMPGDLGILVGTGEYRHNECFIRHYPDGYRMMFVQLADVPTHVALQKAIAIREASLVQVNTPKEPT